MTKQRGRKALFTMFLTFAMLVTLFSSGSFTIAENYNGYNYYPGNDQGANIDPGLALIISGLSGVKFDQYGNPEGGGPANGITVTINGDFEFDWVSANHSILYIFVKAGSGGILFSYGGASSDTGVSIELPQNWNNNENDYHAISHISFYYDPDSLTPTPTATATPTPEATATPTPEATPTSTPEETPASTPEATSLPTPTLTVVVTPTPEAILESTPEPIAEGAAETPVPEMQIADEPIPEAPVELPKTDGLPSTALYGLGGLITAAGLLLKRKLR